ncbi:hypothetical protein COO60DRAFT_76306 [Scenedesmus sp. NREL 46B-D3]|nr:hypothetical protein COO60DRAFT_76306 [Scenedesmus sp. NREL 46B-D3]
MASMDVVAAPISKKQRILEPAAARVPSNNAVDAYVQLEPGSMLMGLPREVLVQILSFLDARGLLAVSKVCKAFRAFDTSSNLRLIESVAKNQALTAAGDQSGRWRRRSWLTRLFIEDCGVGFSSFKWASSSPAPAGVPPQYKFMLPTAPGSYLNIKLDGMGPKLLVSDLSTAHQPVLRWRLVVRGNTAVEFGVVPLSMVDDDKSLHKCHQEEKKFERLRGPLLDAERPTGFCSSITVGSMLPFKTAIMKGSVVELLARRGRLEILVQNPPDGQELYWHNTRTVPKPYKGPREVRFEQDFSPHHDVKLALTSWAHGAFDVLHPAPGTRLLGQDVQRAWDRPVEPWHDGNSSGGSSSEDDDEEGRNAGRGQRTSQRSRAPQGSPLQLQEQQQNAAAEQDDVVIVHGPQQGVAQQARQQSLRQQHLLQQMMRQQQHQQQQQRQPLQQQPVAQQRHPAEAGSSRAAVARATTAAAAGLGSTSPVPEESTDSRDGQLLA